MAATIRDVARAAGVSQATAARALHGYGSVSPASLAKVLDAAERVGYRANRVAQALRSGQLRSVGLIASDIENPFFATVARHLSDALDAEGFTLLVASSDERADREQRIIYTFQTQMVAGLVVAPTAHDDVSHLGAVVEAGIPLVLIDRSAKGIAADTVLVDNFAGAAAAVAHLVSFGHRAIGVVTDDTAIQTSAERLDGYQRAMSSANLDIDPAYVVMGESTRRGGYAAAYQLLDSPARPTAVFSTDNFMTEGVLGAARDLGLRIPQDISVVGFDDFDLLTFVSPPITAVAQPTGQLGVTAAELLIARLKGSDAPLRHIRLPTELIRRNSCAPPAQR